MYNMNDMVTYVNKYGNFNAKVMGRTYAKEVRYDLLLEDRTIRNNVLEEHIKALEISD